MVHCGPGEKLVFIIERTYHVISRLISRQGSVMKDWYPTPIFLGPLSKKILSSLVISILSSPSYLNHGKTMVSIMVISELEAVCRLIFFQKLVTDLMPFYVFNHCH